MSYGFRASGAARARRRPEMGEDIMAVLQRALSAENPTSVHALSGRMQRTGLPSALNERMPVSLSNGEFEFTPEQIYAIGIKAILAMNGERRPAYGGGAGDVKRIGKILDYGVKLGDIGEKSAKAAESAQNNDFFGTLNNGAQQMTSTWEDLVSHLNKDVHDKSIKYLSPVKTITSLADSYDNAKKGEYLKAGNNAIDVIKNGADTANAFFPKVANSAKFIAGKAGVASHILGLVDGVNETRKDLSDHNYWKATWDAAKAIPHAVGAAEPLLTRGALAVLPEAVGYLGPAALAGEAGYALGHSIYENSPQVRDGAARILDSSMKRVTNWQGDLTDEQKQAVENAVTAKYLQKLKAEAAQRGQITYAERMTDAGSDEGKLGSENNKEMQGDKAMDMIGISKDDSPNVAAAKKAYFDQRWQAHEESHQKQLAAQGRTNTDGY